MYHAEPPSTRSQPLMVIHSIYSQPWCKVQMAEEDNDRVGLNYHCTGMQHGNFRCGQLQLRRDPVLNHVCCLHFRYPESLEARIPATKSRILPLLKIGTSHDCNPARTFTDQEHHASENNPNLCLQKSHYQHRTTFRAISQRALLALTQTIASLQESARLLSKHFLDPVESFLTLLNLSCKSRNTRAV